MFFILASLLYSMISLNNIYLQLGFFLLFIFSIYLPFRIFRFVMRSRREITRRECFLKSKLIKNILRGKTIGQSPNMLRSWKSIYSSKLGGFLIETLSSLFTMGLLLIFSLGVIGCCLFAPNISVVDKTIVVIACMSLDNDILGLFVSAIRCEKALVSF